MTVAGGTVRKSILAAVAVYSVINLMPSKTRSADNQQKGISLIELLVVVAILGTLIALAVPNFTKAEVQFQRQNIARQLKIYFERARFDSIKRNAVTFDEMAKVIIHSQTSFSSVVDLNHNGILENNEVRLISISANSGTKIVGNNPTFPITVTFDHRGRSRAVNGANTEVTPTFVVCGQNCTFATANPSNSNTLSISPTGTVALVEAGEVFFDRVVPNVTAVGTGTKINSMAQVSH